MNRQTRGLVKSCAAVTVVFGLTVLGASQLRAGETVSDRVVDSLLLRVAPASQPRTSQPARLEGPAASSASRTSTHVESSPFGLGSLRWLGMGGLILAGAVLVVFGAWKSGWRLKPTTAAGAPIRLVSTRPLGDKKAIAVVDVEGQRLVVGMTTHQVTLLTALPGRPEVPQDYVLEENGEAPLARGRRWTPSMTAPDVGQTSYPDIRGMMAAMRG